MKAFLSRLLRLALVVILVALGVSRSGAAPGDRDDRIRVYTRAIEFDFVSWTLDALWIKYSQAALGTADYLSPADRKQLVLDYLDLVGQIGQLEWRLNQVYADPAVADPRGESAALRDELQRLYERRAHLAPLAEATLQQQVSVIVSEIGLDLGGVPFPPVLYHVTAPPDALIVSPRDRIEQIADISLLPDLTVDRHAALEEAVDRSLNVSSLVVGVGGIGLYPTMVMQTTDINWLAEVVSHEWIHNYLTLRPLGLSYYATPELRIINETTASIAGKEIGQMVIARYYPERLPLPPPPQADTPQTEATPSQPPAFDFRAEMHTTRVTVDALLAEGKIEEAESYMESRRQLFVAQGYAIRKINQAYFAFYGAYADQPGGAAGEDPVGAAVRTLRAQSPSLTAFLKRIARIWSYDELKEMVR